MKVLLLNGSPRMKGNTRAALNAVKEGVEKGLKPEEIELYDISRHKISCCLACDACQKNGGNCVQPDESAELVQKIYDADIVIFGTPVYWWGVSAQLKMAWDKMYSKDFKSQPPKKVGIISVGASGTEDPEYRLIEEQMTCIAAHLGWKLAFAYGVSAYNPGELEANETAISELRELWETLK